VHYSLPWGYWLLGATWSDNRYHQEVFGPYESYRYSGTSSQKELSLSRVLHRDGNSKTLATLKGFWRKSNNYIADLEVIVQRRRTEGVEFSLQHLRYTAFGTLQLQWLHRNGRDAWGDPDLPNTYGHQPWRLDQAHVNWSLPLTEGAAAWTYSTQLQGQWARSPLPPQDRLCLGCRYSVRGFDGQQTLCGDRGQLWRNELAATLPAVISPLPGTQAYLALDAGRAITPGQDDAYRLSGLALGLRGYHKVSDAYPLQWDLFVGRPLSRPEGFTTARRTAGFSLRTEF